MSNNTTHIIPWVAARALFPSLPADPRISDQHDEDNVCPNEVASVCGCASPASSDPDNWTYYTFTSSVEIRAERSAPNAHWMAVVTLPGSARYRKAVVEQIRKKFIEDPSITDWTGTTVEIMLSVEALQAANQSSPLQEAVHDEPVFSPVEMVSVTLDEGIEEEVKEKYGPVECHEYPSLEWMAISGGGWAVMFDADKSESGPDLRVVFASTKKTECDIWTNAYRAGWREARRPAGGFPGDYQGPELHVVRAR